MTSSEEVNFSAPSPKRFTWKRASLWVFAVMVIGMVFSLARPVWLAPPLLQYTPLIYLASGLGWLVVYVVCIFRRPEGGWRIPLGILVVGVLASLVWLTLLGPNFEFNLTSPFSDLNCTSEPFGNGQIRYECRATSFMFYTDYVFEGKEGSLFVRLVGKQSGGT
jgi:hypothetical protein